MTPTSSAQMRIQGINASCVYESAKYTIPVNSNNGVWEMSMHSYPKPTTEVNIPHIDTHDIATTNRISGSQDSKKIFLMMQVMTIVIILGCDFLWDILKMTTIHTLPSESRFMKTPIGSCIIPKTLPPEEKMENRILTMTSESSATESSATNQKLEDLLTKMWQLDALGIQTPEHVEDEKSINDQLIERCRSEAIFREGKIFVALPFNGKERHLSDNFPIAKRRLISLISSLTKKPHIVQTFTKTLKDQEDMGIIEKCDAENSTHQPIYNIPMKIVEKPDSETTKIRIVIDASSHMKHELSLNDCLYPGPCILRPLLGILLRCRLTKFLITSDIEKAFHQVRLQEKHRNATRFIWLNDVEQGPVPGNFVTYRFTRIPFGVSCSPFLLALTIMTFLELKPNDLNDQILENLYVDNLMLEFNDEKEMEKYYGTLKTVFNEMTMNLREFSTNSKTTTEQIPQADRAGKDINKLLGLYWDTIKDQLTINIAKPPSGRPTKRQISSFIGATYDPVGLIAPILVRAKGFQQSLWEAGIGWDDLIPEDTIPIWSSISEEFTTRQIAFARQIVSRYDYKHADLMIFSDASKSYYACSAYVRFEFPDGTVETSLIMSKSKVKPAKGEKLTIPRLELLAIVIASNAAITISDELHISIRKIEFFSDSMIALYWIMGDARLKTYVYNQTRLIKENCKRLNDQDIPTRFHHCPTSVNPADIGSRGMAIDELKDCDLWWKGPEFLTKPECEWPTRMSQTPTYPKCLREEIMKECHNKDNEIDLKAESGKGTPATDIVINVISTETSTQRYESIIPYDRTNSVHKLSRIMIYVSRFLTRLRPKGKWINPAIRLFAESDNETSEWTSVRNLIITDHYKDAAANLNAKVPTEISPHPDEDGLYRYTRRLINSELPQDTKRPIVLIKNHKLTDMIISNTHTENLHIGPVHLVTKLREKFWIPKILQQCRKIVNGCVPCKKAFGRPFKMADIAPLPKERVTRASPFEHVGVDYLGPVLFQGTETTKTKTWVMMVTCLVTRNVHLESAYNNSTSTFLMAMKRFFGRRGIPRSMTLDNAPAFRLGTTMTNQDILERSVDSESLTSFLARKEIQIKFITPYSPWKGGVYERMIGIVKQLLYRTVNPVNLDRYELDTMLVEIEAIINSRPITMNPEKYEDAPVLRPVDLIIPTIRLALPHDHDFHTYPKSSGTMTTEEVTRTYIASFNEQVEETWKLWSSLYLTNMKESSHKNKSYSGTTPKVGQVVLVNTEDVPRHHWPLGWIVKIHSSPDGQERSVTLKCKNKFVKRSLCHLIPLEIIHEDTGVEPDELPRNPSKKKSTTEPTDPDDRIRPRLERAVKRPVNYAE